MKRASLGLLLCAAVGLPAAPAVLAQQFLACEAAPITFDQQLFWTINDLVGAGTIWGNLADCGQPANFTGGGGDALCVTTGVAVAPFDTEAVTNSFTLKGATNAILKFKVNYQDFTGGVDANRTQVVLVDPGATLDELTDGVDRAVRKALRIGSRKFRRNKRRATKAVRALQAALG